MEAGYDVSEASEGLEAICLLDARKIHLVLTDIRMPCSNGISLLKYLKILFRQVPVVVITAYPEDTEDLEPDALLRRPFGGRRADSFDPTSYPGANAVGLYSNAKEK